MTILALIGLLACGGPSPTPAPTPSPTVTDDGPIIAATWSPPPADTPTAADAFFRAWVLRTPVDGGQAELCRLLHAYVIELRSEHLEPGDDPQEVAFMIGHAIAVAYDLDPAQVEACGPTPDS
jgi:hypothetical protein